MALLANKTLLAAFLSAAFTLQSPSGLDLRNARISANYVIGREIVRCILQFDRSVSCDAFKIFHNLQKMKKLIFVLLVLSLLNSIGYGQAYLDKESLYYLALENLTMWNKKWSNPKDEIFISGLPYEKTPREIAGVIFYVRERDDWTEFSEEILKRGDHASSVHVFPIWTTQDTLHVKITTFSFSMKSKEDSTER